MIKITSYPDIWQIVIFIPKFILILQLILNLFQSHCSLALRGGMIIFSLGTISYFILSFIAFVGIYKDLEEFTLKRLHPSIGINAILGIIFTILQTYVIVIFPRLNVHCHKFMNRYNFLVLFFETIISRLQEKILIFFQLFLDLGQNILLQPTLYYGCGHYLKSPFKKYLSCKKKPKKTNSW